MTREQKRLAHNARVRAWVAANPDKRSAINKRYYAKNRDNILLAQQCKGLT